MRNSEIIFPGEPKTDAFEGKKSEMGHARESRTEFTAEVAKSATGYASASARLMAGSHRWQNLIGG